MLLVTGVKPIIDFAVIGLLAVPFKIVLLHDFFKFHEIV